MTDGSAMDVDHDDEGGHGGRTFLLVLVAGAVGWIVLKRRAAAKRKRKERAREARLRSLGFDVKRDKILQKGLDRTGTQATITLHRLRHDLTGDGPRMSSRPARPLRAVELLALAGAMAVFTGLTVGLVTREPLLALLFALAVAVVGILVLGVLALVIGEHRRGG